jgi:hypothetical protein
METTVVQYLLNIAPSLAVCIVLLIRMDNRLRNQQEVVQKELENCWTRLLDHLENELPEE